MSGVLFDLKRITGSPNAIASTPDEEYDDKKISKLLNKLSSNK